MSRNIYLFYYFFYLKNLKDDHTKPGKSSVKRKRSKISSNRSKKFDDSIELTGMKIS